MSIQPPIIALCSQAMGSGKSEVAGHLQRCHGFELVKFAGPLKDMARVLLRHHGVDDSEPYVEGNRKELPLPHFATWLRNRRASSVLEMARALAPHLGIQPEEFDRQLLSERDLAIEAFPELTIHYLLNTLYYDWVDAVAPRHDTVVTPRRIMQTLGTEWGRDRITQDFWTRIAATRCAQHRLNGRAIVIDDMRFMNELVVATRLGSVPVRIVRPGAAVTGGGHASEGELDHVTMAEIINDGSLADLYQKTDDMVAQST